MEALTRRPRTLRIPVALSTPASRHWRLMWFRSQRSLPPRCDALPAQAGSLHAGPLTSGAAFRPQNTSLKSVRRSTKICGRFATIVALGRCSGPPVEGPWSDRCHRSTDRYYFESFDDYWTSLCTGPNSMAQRMKVMAAERREEIHRLVMSSYLAGMEDGPRSFASIVRSVRGVVP